MSSYERGQSKGFNHGVPTRDQADDPNFMRGYRDAEARRDFWANQIQASSQPGVYPSGTPGPASSTSSEPFTLKSAVDGFALAGAVLCMLYAYFGLNGSLWRVVEYGFVGAAGGVAVGAAAWAAVKVLEFALWVAEWALKVALFCGAVYVALHILAAFKA